MASGTGPRGATRDTPRHAYHPYPTTEQRAMPGYRPTPSPMPPTPMSVTSNPGAPPSQHGQFAAHQHHLSQPRGRPMAQQHTYIHPYAFAAGGSSASGLKHASPSSSMSTASNQNTGAHNSPFVGHSSTPAVDPTVRVASPSTSGTSGAVYNPRATIIIIGMKGAGKTTLGLIANRTLGRTFIDTDHLFRSSENASVESFVTAHGWNAFRARETAILKDLLARYPFDTVIACGGGIVESSEARRVLKTARATFPVIRVLREDEAIHAYFDGRWMRQYDENPQAMMDRRAGLYRECCSHTFFNLTCVDSRPSTHSNGSAEQSVSSSSKTDSVGPPSTPHVHPLKFKRVGESFLRLLRAILGSTQEIGSQPATSAAPATPPQPRTAASASSQQQAHARHGHTSSPASTPMSSAMFPPTRNSISHLLSSHGPGPDHEHRRMAERSATGSPAAANVRAGVDGYACLPRRANVLDRSSLLTRRTTAMSLTFPDLTKLDPAMIQEVTQGVDALELRVDMLDCMRPATATARASQPEREPQINYEEVARQLETLRKLAPDLPTLFTLRSDREGGFFYDDRKLSQRDTASPHSQAIYFAFLELAIGMGVELLDVELGWDPWMTKRVIEGRGRTKIVPSYHDLMGALKWETNVPHQLYERACSFGVGVHIVMMIGTTTRSNIEQNTYIGAFSSRILSCAGADPARRMPPLMALNMGLAGRSSRPFNDVLNFVSHPAMPIKAGRGQLSLKEMVETSVRLSIIQTSHFHLYGAVHEEALLVKRTIQSAFDEFGLPYTLLDEGTWSLAEYVETHQRDDIPERDDEAAVINSMSDGLFIAGHASRQAELFGIMERHCAPRITVIARVVQAVDVMARQDMGMTLLGTERGRHVPKALGEMRGPLVGCHTLPAAIARVTYRHLAPINAPSVHRSGLVVILDDGDDANAHANTTIAKRAAVFALAKMGFGSVFVLDEKSQQQQHRGQDPLSRRPSATPAGSRDASVQPGNDDERWVQEVMHLVRHSHADALLDFGDSVVAPHSGEQVQHLHGNPAEDDGGHDATPRLRTKFISLRSLSQPSTGHHTPTPANTSDAAMQHASSDHQSDEDAETIATMREFERHPSKRPCAIILIGGDEAKQTEVMQLVWEQQGQHPAQRPSNSNAAARSVEVASDVEMKNAQQAERVAAPAPSSKAFVLPKEVWESSFGGTIVRITSKRSTAMGYRGAPDRVAADGMAEEPRQEHHDGAVWERGGWIHVKPWMVDRDRVQRNVIEAWTRRSAPSHHLQRVWESWDDGEGKANRRP